MDDVFIIKQAMILSAGLGERMRPITDKIPKPMVEISGKTMIERIINDLLLSGVNRIVINTHYKADVLESYVISRYADANDVEIIFSKEVELLNSGGGVYNALLNKYLKNEPFFVINSDLIFTTLKSELLILTEQYFSLKPDIAMFVKKPEECFGIEDEPLYLINNFTNELHRINGNFVNGQFVYVGISIIKPEIFFYYNKSKEKFSLSEFFIQASEKRKLSGKNFKGIVYQVDRPEKISQCEDYISKEISKKINIGNIVK